MNSDESGETHAPRAFGGLGICWLLYGILRLAGAVWLFLFTSTATLMFGALLNRVADPFSLMAAFHVIYAAVVVYSATCGVVAVIAGLALLSGQRSARTLGVLAAVLSLSGVPLGTTLGIYTLIVLLPRMGRSASSAAVEGQRARLSHQTMPM